MSAAAGNLRVGRPPVHGATSEAQVRPRAANHRRRVLRQIGTTASALDPLARGYLDAYVRLMAKIEMIDAYVAEYGLIRADGEPQAVLKLYTSLENSARLSLARLEGHLHQRGSDPVADLNAYLLAKRLAAAQ